MTDALRDLTGQERLLILIDQEGGRVARLRPPCWRKAPSAAELAAGEPEAARRLIYLNGRLMARELQAMGITVNCVPLADVPARDCHDIIGDRAFGTTPQQVTDYAGVQAKAMLEGGILPVLKHIPGHGRARVDSHEDLPEVEASLEELRACDFIPFQKLNHLPLGMTAHIRYTAIDPERVATVSPSAIHLIREEIRFKGVLMSDDVSMKALQGGMEVLSRQIIAAGCDLVLHCNGKMDEMQQVAAALEQAGDALVMRLNAVWDALPAEGNADHMTLREEYDKLVEELV